MTSGAYMGIVGVYLILFGMMKEIEPLNWIGLILATIGFIIAACAEDDLEDRIRKLEKKNPIFEVTKK